VLVLQSVRLGLTDPATLHFIAEDAILTEVKDPEQTYIQCILPEKVAMQIAYIEHQTLMSDFVVLFKTIGQLWSKTARQKSACNIRRLLQIE
jgi:lipopolysaccharide/colanic/teichoic acid biosynthesis glycosyltransferase